MTSKEVSQATLHTPTNRDNPRWKRWTARALLVIFCIGIALSIVSIWMRNQIDDTDRYLRTVGPLASNPAIQESVITGVTDRFSVFLDEASTRDSLSERQRYLAAPLTLLLNNFVEDTVRSLVTSDEFPQYWMKANELVHPRVSAILTGEGTENVSTAGGKITLDLTPLVEAVKGRLRDRGVDFFDRIPGDQLDPQVVIVDSPELAKAQDWIDVLDTLAYILPILSLLAVAGYILLSSDRRRAVIWSGFGLALAMASLLLLLSLGRSLYVDGLDSSVSKNAATAFFDIIGRYLRYAAQAVAVVGLVIAALAIVTRTGSWTRQERSVIADHLAATWRQARAKIHRPQNAGSSFVRGRTALLAALLLICSVAIVWLNQNAFGWAITFALIVLTGYIANSLLLAPSTNLPTNSAITIPAEAVPPSAPATVTRASRVKTADAGKAAEASLMAVARDLSPEDIRVLERLAVLFRGSAGT
jgi:hypothetical protein